MLCDMLVTTLLGRLTILLIYASTCARLGSAHVSWLFPASREPPFDSLNFEQNVQPCGGLSPTEGTRNIFIVGREYNLTWRTVFYHTGGLQINLLHANGTKFRRLIPNENDSSFDFFDTEMNQEQTISVTFEDSCSNCIIQLLKQAQDLNPRFLYVSCADVEILTAAEESVRKNDETECQSKGIWKSVNRCDCDNNHEGAFCERKVDCKTDADCGKDGVCREQWNSGNFKVCHCAYGYFGVNCEKSSAIDPEDKCFNVNGLESEKRIDFVSYGLFDQDCYDQINLADNDFVYSRLVDSELEIILDFDTLSYAAIGWRPMEIGVECREFPQLTDADHSGYSDRAYGEPLHPMACVDIVWSAVVNDTRLYIRDGYSRDKHTPLTDEQLGGQNSITSAFGVQIVDRTVIMFRRPISSEEATDHSLGPGPLFGIFAKGQAEGETRWVANQTLAQSLAQSPNRIFYRQDELSYHGNNRGIVAFEFFKKTNELNSAITKQLTKVVFVGFSTTSLLYCFRDFY